MVFLYGLSLRILSIHFLNLLSPLTFSMNFLYRLFQWTVSIDFLNGPSLWTFSMSFFYEFSLCTLSMDFIYGLYLSTIYIEFLNALPQYYHYTIAYCSNIYCTYIYHYLAIDYHIHHHNWCIFLHLFYVTLCFNL